MQQVGYELFTHLGAYDAVDLIAWGHSQLFLPLFIFWACVKSIAVLARRRHRTQVVLLGDALLAPLGLVIKWLSKCPVVIIAHGLDVTFPNAIYQLIVPRCLRRLDRIVAVSEHTRRVCIDRGIVPERCVVIPNGVRAPSQDLDDTTARHEAGKIIGANLTSCSALLTVGRLVQRKGVAWFIADVLPALIEVYPELVYIVAGDGPHRPRIEEVIRQHQLTDHVFLLGRVDAHMLETLYRASDVFVMPNIIVKDDVEGFGLVGLEAGARGRWVVASRVDGIEAALFDGENGSLVSPGDASGYVAKISELLSDKNLRQQLELHAREFVEKNFDWPVIALRYHDVMSHIAIL
jgi:glycosyltransferase involved in cell wall biosynthesis